MANSSQGDQNANRTIIIPKGVLDPNQVNVINIPRRMNTTAPLLVTARKDGGGLRSQTLPIWRDELSSPGKCRPTNLKATPQPCSSNKRNDSTFSSMYDSSAELDMDATGFNKPLCIGDYNVVKPMTPSPKRLWPKLPEHMMGRGFMPRHMSSPQEGVDPRFMNDGTFPSTLLSQDFQDPDLSGMDEFSGLEEMSGMQESSASSKTSGTDGECDCSSEEDVNATFDQPQIPNATFNRLQNANATYNQSIRRTSPANQPQNPNATFYRPQQPNASFNRAQQSNATFNRVQQANATFNRSLNANATINRSLKANASFTRPQQQPNATFNGPQLDEDENCVCSPVGDGGTFNQSQNMNRAYAQHGGQFSQYQQLADNTFEEQYQSDVEDGHGMRYATQIATFGDSQDPRTDDSYFADQSYRSPSPPRGGRARSPQPSSYRTSPAAACGPSSGAAHQVCSNMEEDPYSPRVVHMSSRTVTQVNNEPPESRSIIVDAPDGVDEPSLRYATQMATFSDSDRRTDDSYFAGQSYSGQPSCMGNTGYGFQEHSAAAMRHTSAGYGQQYGFQEQGLDQLKRSGCDPLCKGRSHSRAR